MTKSIRNRCLRIARRQYYRAVSLLLTLTVLVGTFPGLPTPVPAIAGIGDLIQLDYRWYLNIDSALPATTLAAENTGFSGATDGAVYHLRVNVNNTGDKIDKPADFKLQYSTSTGGPWTDVGGIGSGETWRGFDNSSVADGDSVSKLLTATEGEQTYEEANPATIINDFDGPDKPNEWDWVVQGNAALGSTTYYFRMVKSGGTALGGYTNYAQLTTAAATLSQEDYRWYDNTDAVQPTAPLAAENTATTGVAITTLRPQTVPTCLPR